MDSIVTLQEKTQLTDIKDITMNNRLEIIDEGVRKKYLSRLTEMEIANILNLEEAETDFIKNVRMYRLSEMVYKKGESVIDKFTTVFNTLSIYNTSLFVLIDSDGKNTNFYLGVRNNEFDTSSNKRSTVAIGETLKQTLIGHFPGTSLVNEDRKQIEEISKKIKSLNNVASVSVVGNNRLDKTQTNEQFVQGIEKLCLSMSGKAYVGLIIADNQSSQMVQELRKQYQDLYTKLSPYQKIQFTDNTSQSTSRNKSFMEMSGKQKAAMIGSAAIGIAGVLGGFMLGGPYGAAIGGSLAKATQETMRQTYQSMGMMLGGQVTSQLSGFISALAPNEQISNSYSKSTSSTTENKAITDMMTMIDELIKKTDEYDSYGLWNVAGYFISDDMSAAEIEEKYQQLIHGEIVEKM